MARTTETLIREIIEIDSSVTTLTPFMNIAHQMVEKHCSGIDEAEATLVETWLAAHFITIRDMREAQEKASEVSTNYQYKIDLGLNSSMYGQTAMNIDSTGGLARWNKLIKDGGAGRKSSVIWLGSEL